MISPFGMGGLGSGFGGGGGGGFSPASLFAGGTEGAWYDPSDLTTLFQDSAGTTPVTTAGQPVGLMLDKSGRAHHAIQSTPSKRPTYTTGSGLAWLAFDGVDDAMSTGGIDFTGTDKATVFAGLRKLSEAATGLLFETSAAADANNGAFALATPTASAANSFSFVGRGTTTSANATANALTAPQTAVLTGLLDIAGPLNRTRKNGVDVATVTTTLGTGNFGNYALNLGARSGTSIFFNGNLYGLIMPGKLASAAEIAPTETYLAAKSGVTL